jgi:hypothetical protein
MARAGGATSYDCSVSAAAASLTVPHCLMAGKSRKNYANNQQSCGGMVLARTTAMD